MAEFLIRHGFKTTPDKTHVRTAVDGAGKPVNPIYDIGQNKLKKASALKVEKKKRANRERHKELSKLEIPRRSNVHGGRLGLRKREQFLKEQPDF